MLDQWTWPDSLKPDRIFNWQLSTKRSGVIDSKWYRGEMGSQCDYHDFSFSKITALGNEYLLSRWLLCWNILWLSLSLKNCSQQNGLGPNPVLKMQLEYDGQHRELLSLGKNNSQTGFIFSGVWLVSTFALLEISVRKGPAFHVNVNCRKLKTSHCTPANHYADNILHTDK